MRTETKTVRYICDRCGKETKTGHPAWIGRRLNLAIAYLTWLTGAGSILDPEYKRVDLCSDCLKSFVRWLRGRSE